LVNNIN